MANQTNRNQFRDDEIIIPEPLRDGKMVKNIFPKIGGRLRLAHEENDQLSITTEIIKYDENLAVILGLMILSVSGSDRVSMINQKGDARSWEIEQGSTMFAATNAYTRAAHEADLTAE